MGDKRIIAVNSNCYHGYSIERAIEGIKNAGYHYVELTATKGWTEHVFPTQSFEYLQGLKDKLEDMDLVPFAMSGHTNLMDEERLPDFIMNIKLAAFFGCNYIVTSVGEAHLTDKRKSGNEVLINHINSLIPYLNRYHIQMVIETHGEHGSGKILEDIVEAVDSEYVKINYDTANVIFYGKVKPEEDIKNCIKNVTYMHLKDKLGDKGEWNFPAPGKGYIDFPRIFSELRNAGNNCPFSIEIEFTPKGTANAEEVDQAIKDAAEYLISQGFEL
ncbi:sugar phosphate isomerase/epimerase family protein [Porcincola intestinalis]|jgi:L-ribulose-5-phosphate 3-epimerase|uniref:sugar phosphate isomerase/epimerase family protein n=1 Tax=Porcincola intestinalis TaxID=2606632 RepID=UPI0023F2C7A4|nr:sugar phosphate isomerase/epimerase [Porcincola intestinalis]MCI6768005.1 sugar phosphate isomerase/epimerase [Lachnospiraceae bacterium]MDD7060239.1 sugar phosphate isomerase/epimerase [Porcincola intestinalis]MDY5284307.1 sugar phosphate isomerase/epimerase [Porcincola intestinalis]